ncbi:hypothetical protein JQS43_03230 [Natronosporangium hydrolyticum]|uniref:Uncharacterized protein n=1 Tax=Natronosporangium hydrolyticum TaxID=2811111 RepID=A0A895YC72_9ACTN|nr:hypothetical protein [Natronosporangium hydrolyticum]QSB15387.1 hypothetical protein JQS43_03230 [Natronosporangium hydrolyticum]
MSEPSVWGSILADPTLPFDRPTLRQVVADQRRWSRRWLYPLARVVSRIGVVLILVMKRLMPFAPRLRAHAAMDRMCVWFVRRCVAPESAGLLLRHFVIETNLLNFVVRNAGLPGMPEVTLLPTALRQLGDRAVIEHDLNVYEVLAALGSGVRDRPLWARAASELDYSMLTVPQLDLEPATRRWLRLDIQTALCLMNIPFALCLTPREYRRAVHSLRLDESLLAILATLTGDATFRSWRPAGTLVRVDSAVDVPRAVYEHAVICEQAHAHLLTCQSLAAPIMDLGTWSGRKSVPNPMID